MAHTPTSSSNSPKMKVLLVLAAAFLTVAHCHPSVSHPDVPENLQLLQSSNDDDLQLLSRATVASDIFYQLYTRLNPTTAQYLTTEGSMVASNFNPEHDTRMIIHGWNNDGTSEVCTLLRDAYLAKGDFNVIVVDWGISARTGTNVITDYYPAQSQVEAVGNFTGQFLLRLQDVFSLDLETVNIAGHSLGAHVAGFTGKWVKVDGQPTVGSIVGLDTTLLGYFEDKGPWRLHDQDAKYVQSIHTSALGFQTAIGVASFYPNYANGQPGCNWDWFSTCAHGRAYHYYAESITSTTTFAARRCEDYSKISGKSCITSTGTSYMGGEPLDTNSSGYYWVPVNSASPYAKGAAGIV